MKKIWFSFIVCIILSSVFFNIFLIAEEVEAQFGKDQSQIVGEGLVATKTNIKIAQALQSIIKWVLGFSMGIVVVALMYGGFRYITSGGNDTQKETAKKIVTYAIIGLVIIILSYTITTFFLEGLISLFL